MCILARHTTHQPYLLTTRPGPVYLHNNPALVPYQCNILRPTPPPPYHCTILRPKHSPGHLRHPSGNKNPSHLHPITLLHSLRSHTGIRSRNPPRPTPYHTHHVTLRTYTRLRTKTNVIQTTQRLQTLPEYPQYYRRFAITYVLFPRVLYQVQGQP